MPLTNQDRGWHLQACYREWILWGYGPRPDHLANEPPEVGSHIDPAVYVFPTDGMQDVTFPFSLPKHVKGSKLPVAVEYGRRLAWGWRIRSNDFRIDCPWHLITPDIIDALAGVSPVLACIAAAEDYLQCQENHRTRARDDRDDAFERCLEDVREYGSTH